MPITGKGERNVTHLASASITPQSAYRRGSRLQLCSLCYPLTPARPLANGHKPSSALNWMVRMKWVMQRGSVPEKVMGWMRLNAVDKLKPCPGDTVMPLANGEAAQGLQSRPALGEVALLERSRFTARGAPGSWTTVGGSCLLHSLQLASYSCSLKNAVWPQWPMFCLHPV